MQYGDRTNESEMKNEDRMDFHHCDACAFNNKELFMTDKTKRVTIPVSCDIDKIRDRLAADTGITMTYTQVFNFLIHFYVERANEPKSKWKSLS